MDPTEAGGFLVALVALAVPVVVGRTRRAGRQQALERGFVVDEKSRRLPPSEGVNAGLQKRLGTIEPEKKLLEERIRNLESIVCSVDLELNARLVQLAQSSVAAPRPGPLAAGGADRPLGSAVPAAAIGPGKVLVSRYHIDRELGHGGMGA